MKLGARITPDSVVIYREKWGALAMSAALGATLIGFALWFYIVGADRAPPMFFVPFCIAFGLTGVAIFWRLPKEAGKWFAQDGMVLLRADSGGVEIAPLPGATPSVYKWSDIAGIALVERLKIVDLDERYFNWNEIVLFVRKESLPVATRFNVGLAGLAFSGEGRVYALIDSARKDGARLVEAFRALAPSGVDVGRHKSALFDRKARKDSYS